MYSPKIVQTAPYFYGALYFENVKKKYLWLLVRSIKTAKQQMRINLS